MVDKVLRQLRKMQAGRSLREFGATLGVSAVYLSDIFNGKREPSESIARAAGFEKVVKRLVTYKPLK